jgi:two-component system alkaline phosphatase synthesis response regulator PhoP
MAEEKSCILLVEDEESLRETLKLNLEMEGYEVTAVDNGKKAVKAFQQEYFDCILLDIMMPEADGLEVCQNIRLVNDKVPILFMSAKSSSADRIAGLKQGGDDYVTKPFNLEELLLRVQNLVNKNKKLEQIREHVDSYNIGSCGINFVAQLCTDVNGNEQMLTKKEVMLLRLLVESKNEVVTREHILKMVWGYNVFPSTRTVDNFILVFRKYFEKDPRNPVHFLSIRGMGYKFVE